MIEKEEDIDLVKAAGSRPIQPIIILFLVFVIGLLLIGNSYITPEQPTRMSRLLSSPPEEERKITILILGLDKLRVVSRSDTIMVAFIDPQKLSIRIISVPRDTRVRIPGRGYNKINTAYVFGGVPLLTQVVEDLMGIDVDYFVLTNLQGFVNIVDLFGGIEVDIPEDMHYIDRADGLEIDLKKGKQNLDGLKAMQFVRYRDPIRADIGRIERQQQFLDAMAAKVLGLSTIMKIPNLAKIAFDNIETDLMMAEILELGKKYLGRKKPQISFVTVPGEAEYIERVSYYIADIPALRKMVKEEKYIDDLFD